MATSVMKKAFAAMSTITLANANLTIYCYVNDAPIDKRFGGLTTYQKCNQNKCTCSVFELLCLDRDVRKKAVVLKSVSASEARDCKTCLCNDDLKEWAKSANLQGYQEALPLTPRLPMPEYEVFIK